MSLHYPHRNSEVCVASPSAEKILDKAETGTVARRGNIDLEPGAGHWTKTNDW